MIRRAGEPETSAYSLSYRNVVGDRTRPVSRQIKVQHESVQQEFAIKNLQNN